MKITLLLLFPLSTAAYNLHVNGAFVYQSPGMYNQRNKTDNSHFGYSVLLHSRKRESNNKTVFESWVFVGAPKANYAKSSDYESHHVPKEPGIAYRCPMDFSLYPACEPINVSNPDDEVGFIGQVKRHILIEKKYGWLGAAMSLDASTDTLIVCAPRTVVRIYNLTGIDYQNTMQGFCYTGKASRGNLYMDDKNLTNYNFNSSKVWYNPLDGFAVHFPASQKINQSNFFEPIIGSPKHEFYGSVHKMGQHNTVELPIGDDVNQFGYALTSGCYFHEMQLMVAGGAPGWQYVGQVAVMDPRTDPLSIIVTINGKEVGEFFGSSLATGDMNNDGLDDLIVGAPHWNNDNGRVHIFFGNKAGFYDADLLLEGTVDDALYGYALTSGDLDGDGFDDLIVGAPWEDFGVIYVYNGDVNLRDFPLLKPSQRIAAAEIDPKIRTFGFSLAKPVDIDDNGFPDVAVGAYASGHVIILKTAQIVETSIALFTDPETLNRYSTSFRLSMIASRNSRFYTPELLLRSVCFKVEFDKNDRRVVHDDLCGVTWHSLHSAGHTKMFQLQKNITNYLDAIQIVVHLGWARERGREECGERYSGLSVPCPMEYKARSATARIDVAFDIGCGNDNVCQSYIVADLYFRGIRNSTWIIGSDDLSLVLKIGNRAEPAYSTTVTFNMPKGINLRSLRPSCQESGTPDNVIVTCDVGNPLRTAMEETISLDLDMTRVSNDAADDTVLNFRVEIKTRSVNAGNSSIVIPLRLKANVSVDLSGKAYDNSYYIKYNDKPMNLSFQHAYQITRFGETTISEALLKFWIPYKLNKLEFLTMVREPRVSVVGRMFECSVTGVSVTKPRSVEKSPIRATIDDNFNFNRISNSSPAYLSTSDAMSDRALTVTTEHENDDNARPKFFTTTESSDVDVIYLNCSTSNVTCGRVVCKIPRLKKSQDVVKLQLWLLVDDSTFAVKGGSDGKERIIHITTEGSIDISDPKIKFSITGAGIKVPVTTTLRYAPNVRVSVSIWIILVSILLGLFSLGLITRTLWKYGFFVRSKKNELDRMKKSDDLSLHSNSLTEE